MVVLGSPTQGAMMILDWVMTTRSLQAQVLIPMLIEPI